MNKILLLDPATSSLNLGDEIIRDAVQKGISNVLKGNFVITLSTHLPVSIMYERIIGRCDYKFVCGSNLLMGKLNRRFKQWHISFKDIFFLKDSILIGAGWWQYKNTPNLYTKILYKCILSKNYIHSVRDQYTVEMLKSMGIDNVINTGCPTLWMLTPEHCQKLPKEKSENVLFTLTDYNKDAEKDKMMVDILLANYKKVYFWGQGVSDYKYLKALGYQDEVIIIDPTLQAYDELLKKEELDYVGTRLHGGIRALQHSKRTLIVAIDNRANEMSKDFGLNIIQRDQIESLNKLINSNMELKIRLPWDNIKKWKNQFEV